MKNKFLLLSLAVAITTAFVSVSCINLALAQSSYSSSAYTGSSYSSLTFSQVQAIMNLLQSFGASQEVINNVQSSLTGTSTTGGGGGSSSSSTQPSINFDVNHDGKVDIVDIGYVSQAINASHYDAILDFNSDGKVDAKDLSIITKVSSQPSITVLSPNGGESWQAGTTQTIKWQDSRPTDLVQVSYDIKLLPDCTASICPAYAIDPYTIANHVSGSSYSWPVGNIEAIATTNSQLAIAPNGAYTIQICQTGTDRCDKSDSYFKIYSSTSGNQPPVISGITAPTQLNIGQMGTWTVKAYDPENGSLSYSVTWGDETSFSGASHAVTPQAIQQFIQNATFTHAYSNPGVYTPTFIVKDNTGLTAKTSTTVQVGNTTQSIPVKIINDTTYGATGSDAFVRLFIAGYPTNRQVDHWVLGYTCLSGVTLDTGSADGKPLLCNGTDAGKNGLTFYSRNMYDPTSDYLMITAGAKNNNSYSVELHFSLDARDMNDRSIGTPDYKTISLKANVNSTQSPITSVYATVVSANEDKVGTWDVFGPGKGSYYPETNLDSIRGRSNDWSWQATLALGETKTISYIEVFHEGTNQIWSTKNSYNFPLLVYREKNNQINTQYGQTLGTYSAGTKTTFSLYGQIDNTNTYGTLITVGFTDGTIVTGKIPSTNIRPVIIPTVQQPSITVLSPNGGEVLKVGDQYRIKWSSTNLPSDAKIGIVLFKGTGALNTLIVNNLSVSQNEYVWAVTENGDWGYGFNKVENILANVIRTILGVKIANADDNTYRIMVTASWNNYGNAYDYSNSYFTITASTTSNPSITVLSPNGGETFSKNMQYKVFWKTNNIPATNSMTVRLRSVASGQELLTTQEPNTGIGGINIPADFADGKYKLEVKTSVNGTSYIDTSDDSFLISSPTPSITVLSPNGGEVFRVGDNVKINWISSSNVSKISVLLHKDGLEYIIANNINNTGSYTWIIPSVIPHVFPEGGNLLFGNGFTIMILAENNSNPKLYDESNSSFTITVPTPTPSITVTPTQSSMYEIGGKIPVTWTTNQKGGTVKIELVNTDSSVDQPVPVSTTVSSDANGSYTISLGSDFPQGYYYVRVTYTPTNGQTPISALSGQFQVRPAGSISSSSGSSMTANMLDALKLAFPIYR